MPSVLPVTLEAGLNEQAQPTPADSGSLDRVALYSLGANLGLSALKLALSATSGSLALAADGIHSLVDVFSSVAVLVGLRLAARKSPRFPYGLYKVENVVSVVIALLIFLAGYEIVRRALAPAPAGIVPTAGLVAGVAVTVLGPWLFSRYELAVARRSGSPSLLADGRHFQVDVLSSGIVLLSILGAYLGLGLDRIAAVIVVLFIAYAGWELLRDAMRVLLDASVDPETLEDARDVLSRAPAVAEVRWVTGRNSGRVRFLEADVTLRTQDLRKADLVARQLERELRQEVPNLERVIIRYEPAARPVHRLAVPLADPSGTISDHLGEAPYFALVDVRAADGQVVRQEVLPNPHLDVPKGKGIRVAEWLVAQKVDQVYLREDVRGKGPEYVFADAGVEVTLTPAGRVQEVLAPGGARL